MTTIRLACQADHREIPFEFDIDEPGDESSLVHSQKSNFVTILNCLKSSLTVDSLELSLAVINCSRLVKMISFVFFPLSANWGHIKFN